jgi:type IV pilus assembly protein PilW
MTLRATQIRPLRSAGFSLIEILVGVAIGLMGIVIMLQVMENAESRKRTTASGSDAQISGSIAMFNLERDIRIAGNGFASSTAMGCTVQAYDDTRGSFSFLMVPIQIVDGSSGAPDQIIALYGYSETAPLGYTFDTSADFSKKMASNTSTRGGLMRGDLAFVTVGSNCGMIEITDNTAADQLTIDHSNTGTAYTSDYLISPPSNYGATARFNAAFDFSPGQIYNLGQRDNVRRNIWQVASRRILTVTDDIHSSAAMEMGEGIVNLQAQYGLDTSATRDYLVDTWQATTPTDWTRVIAIRVALLARSQHYEKDIVTSTAPTWAGGNFTMTDLDGATAASDSTANDWRHYRYRVYQTTIPLRNMIWGTAP